MTKKVSLAEFKAKLQADPDALALDLLPEGSFARWAYQNKSYPAVRAPHAPAEADKPECEKWDLTPEEWSEQMAITRWSVAHDMKLDLIKEGYF